MRDPETPPLHPEIAALAHMVRTQAHWQLPEFVGDFSRAGVDQWRRLLAWGTVLLLVPIVIVAGIYDLFTMLAMCAVLVGLWGAWRWWWLHKAWPLGSPFVQFDDAPLQWRGCVVDVAQRTLHTVGLKHNLVCNLQPGAQWSLGGLDFSCVEVHHVPNIHCVVELRHVRRGPVLVLCSIQQPCNYTAHREQLQALAEAMAQRLGIRLSGNGLLLPASGRGVGASVGKNQR